MRYVISGVDRALAAVRYAAAAWLLRDVDVRAVEGIEHHNVATTVPDEEVTDLHLAEAAHFLGQLPSWQRRPVGPAAPLRLAGPEHRRDEA